MTQELIDDDGEAPSGELTEILGEHAPDALQNEVAALVGAAAAPVAQPAAEVGDQQGGLARDLDLPSLEDRLVAGQEEQRVVVV